MSASLSSLCLVRQCVGSCAFGQRASATTSRIVFAPAMPLKWLLLHRATSARNGQQTDGASTAVSVGSSTALNAYLATRRAEVDRLRTEPAPLRVHAIEDAHRRAILDVAAAPMMLSPADGASADGTLGATKSQSGRH